MKTKKLIELLQKEDPSGEGEVLISTEDGNVDIFILETKEMQKWVDGQRKEIKEIYKKVKNQND